MVVVREQHITRPRIPDPAVETALQRRLIDEGFKVVDRDRINEIRYAEVVDRILKKGPNWQADAIRLGRRFGADVLVTGDAFTQMVSRSREETELGQVDVIRCSGRVELRAIRMDTGEIIYADSTQGVGTPDFTEELSSKKCLEQLGTQMGDGLLAKMQKLSAPTAQFVELQVRGLSSFTAANKLARALRNVDGVVDVSDPDLEGGVARFDLQLRKSAVGALPERLEHVKGYRLRVQSANKSKIIANVK
jgi:hypothetical protein